MRVLSESIAELFLLSRAELLVTQQSSHFSTMAALLIWARTGAAQPAAALRYLDASLIAAGVVSTSLLHGSLNGTSALAPSRAHERWVGHTRRFLEGLPLSPSSVRVAPAGSLSGGARAPPDVYLPSVRLAMAEGIPLFPGDLFYREARRWGGAGGQVWPGECPLEPLEPLDPLEGAARQRTPEALRELISVNINHGADHNDLHPGQSERCWRAAAGALRRLRSVPVSRPSGGAPAVSIEDLEDVISGNLAAYGSQSCFPYSMDAASLMRFYRNNLGTPRWWAGKWKDKGAKRGHAEG